MQGSATKRSTWVFSGGTVEWDGVRYSVWATPWCSFWLRAKQPKIDVIPVMEERAAQQQELEVLAQGLTPERKRYMPPELVKELEALEPAKETRKERLQRVYDETFDSLTKGYFK